MIDDVLEAVALVDGQEVAEIGCGGGCRRAGAISRAGWGPSTLRAVAALLRVAVARKDTMDPDRLSRALTENHHREEQPPGHPAAPLPDADGPDTVGPSLPE